MKQYLEAGKIVSTHGIRGEVRIESWCDSPDVLCSLETVYMQGANGSFLPLRIAGSSVHKKMALVKIDGVDTIDDALRLKNKVVYARRQDLPLDEGSHFIADLIGLPVTDADSGIIYGKLTDVIKNAASDVYEITQKNGAKAYMPAVAEFVTEIDIERGIFVRPIGGMFDEPDNNSGSDEIDDI